MAAFVRFQSVAAKVAAGDFVNVLNTDTDVVRAYLSNTAPNVATMVNKADLAEIATGNGYAGPVDVQNARSESAGVISVAGTDITITAAGGSVGPFRYVPIYDDTLVNDPLIGYWDYGSAITLASGESFTIDFAAAFLTVGG